MPIYEYQSRDPAAACRRCRARFEAIHSATARLLACPDCGARLDLLVSWCHAASGPETAALARTEAAVKGYEKQQLWSHAAELADRQAGRLKSASLRSRALENYKKAGHRVAAVERYAQKSPGPAGSSDVS